MWLAVDGCRELASATEQTQQLFTAVAGNKAAAFPRLSPSRYLFPPPSPQASSLPQAGAGLTSPWSTSTLLTWLILLR